MAADGNALVPPPNRGRLTWVRDQFAARFDHKIAVETVRKWFAGETKPRPKAMAALAEILQVDEAWLALGTSPKETVKERRVRDATADGAVNLVAGMISMDGSTPAFPEPGASGADNPCVDLFAIIKGGQYSIHVVVGERVDGGWEFSVPVGALSCVTIGVIQKEGFCFDLVELDAEGLESVGERKGGSIEVLLSDMLKTGDYEWRRITTFRERLVTAGHVSRHRTGVADDIGICATGSFETQDRKFSISRNDGQNDGRAYFMEQKQRS